MRCKRCGNDYGRRDDLTLNPNGDPEWVEHDGRCYGCYLDMLHDIYGGLLEPEFTITQPSVDIYF